MNAAVPEIRLVELALMFIPVALVVGLLWRWSLEWKEAAYATIRMLAQLLLVGYLLNSIFAAERWWIVGLVLVSSWIALRPLAEKGSRNWWFALLSIGGAMPANALKRQLVSQGDSSCPRTTSRGSGLSLA